MLKKKILKLINPAAPFSLFKRATQRSTIGLESNCKLRPSWH
jgi:hypothetical protein